MAHVDVECNRSFLNCYGYNSVYALQALCGVFRCAALIGYSCRILPAGSLLGICPI